MFCARICFCIKQNKILSFFLTKLMATASQDHVVTKRLVDKKKHASFCSLTSIGSAPRSFFVTYVVFLCDRAY